MQSTCCCNNENKSWNRQSLLFIVGSTERKLQRIVPLSTICLESRTRGKNCLPFPAGRYPAQLPPKRIHWLPSNLLPIRPTCNNLDRWRSRHTKWQYNDRWSEWSTMDLHRFVIRFPTLHDCFDRLRRHTILDRYNRWPFHWHPRRWTSGLWFFFLWCMRRFWVPCWLLDTSMESTIPWRGWECCQRQWYRMVHLRIVEIRSRRPKSTRRSLDFARRFS